MALREPSQRLRRIAAAGMFFEGGAATVDPTTIIAALVHGLTGSTLAVGATSAISRYGWLFPQLFVGYAAARRRRRMPLYGLGAFGRAGCLLGVAAVLAAADTMPLAALVITFFVLWTAYAFVSGIVAVPYNDIVARAIRSERRSRMLALRFFGGGLLALGVAASAHRLFSAVPFPNGHAALIAFGSVLLLVSALCFVSAGEPSAPEPGPPRGGFGAFLGEGVTVFRVDRRFRLFVYSQWFGGAVMMALPFYALQAIETGARAGDIATLLGAQTAGALAANPLWGWWGDRRGKQSLLEGVAALRALPPMLTILWAPFAVESGMPVAGFAAAFVLIGGLGSGGTIAMLGYLMEISPNDRRPAYSGYFNALVAPAALLPLLGAVIVEVSSLGWVFAASLLASAVQLRLVRRLRSPVCAAP